MHRERSFSSHFPNLDPCNARQMSHNLQEGNKSNKLGSINFKSSCTRMDLSTSILQEVVRSYRFVDRKRISLVCITFGLYCISINVNKILTLISKCQLIVQVISLPIRFWPIVAFSHWSIWFLFYSFIFSR